MTWSELDPPKIEGKIGPLCTHLRTLYSLTIEVSNGILGIQEGKKA